MGSNSLSQLINTDIMLLVMYDFNSHAPIRAECTTESGAQRRKFKFLPIEFSYCAVLKQLCLPQRTTVAINSIPPTFCRLKQGQACSIQILSPRGTVPACHASTTTMVHMDDQGCVHCLDLRFKSLFSTDVKARRWGCSFADDLYI